MSKESYKQWRNGWRKCQLSSIMANVNLGLICEKPKIGVRRRAAWAAEAACVVHENDIYCF
jgi:hypothetical protein